MSSTITINGRLIKVGTSVNIIDGKIVSDGVVVSEFDSSETVVIEKIEGDVQLAGKIK